MAVTDPTDIADSVEEAVARGSRFYRAKEPCKRGHFAPRRTINYGCLECEREGLRRRRQAAKEGAPTHPKTASRLTRAEAVASGGKRYFTGLPCSRGHVAERYVNSNTCVSCDLERKINNPSVKDRTRRYYDANREAIIAQNKAYQAANAATINAKRATFRMANKDRINAKIAEWAKANPAKRRAKERAREGRERGAEGTHTWADIEALKVMQNGLCAAPGCKALLADGFHVDHVIAISKGGSNWPANLQLLCPPHNQSKAARDLDEWIAVHKTSG